MRASDFYRDTSRIQAAYAARRKAEEQANPTPKPPSELEILRARVAELEADNADLWEMVHLKGDIAAQLGDANVELVTERERITSANLDVEDGKSAR